MLRITIININILNSRNMSKFLTKFIELLKKIID